MSDEVMEVSTSMAMPVAASAAGPAGNAPRPPPQATPVMDRLLSMADHCLHDNLLRQAAEMYFEVLDREGVGEDALVYARQRLMEIADYYRRTGNPHQARGIYEQLL